MSILIILGFAANAEQRKSEIKKLDFLRMKKESMANGINSSQFKQLFISNDQFSVPGYSEDFSWDVGLNDWLHDSNTTYTYDGAGKLTEEITKESGSNMNVSRISYSYDFHGNITEEVSYVWINNEWTPVAGDKSVYMINAESQFSGIIEQVLENGIWVNKTKTVYALNTYNIPIGIVTYKWEANDWMIYSKTTNLTWADWPTRKLATYTLLYWQNNTWFNGERYFTQYDGENYTATTETWVNVEWVNTKRETYSRTLFNEEIILENWTESGWEKTEKYKGTFDAYGNPTGMFYSTWHENKWVTETELFFDLAFNQSNDVVEMIFRYRDPGLSVPINIAKYKYSNFIHFGTTDIKDVNVLENVTAFPNPVANSLNIRIDDTNTSEFNVSITNLAGQTIFTKNYSSPTITVNTEGFTKGMYLLNLKSSDGKIYNSKFLKK